MRMAVIKVLCSECLIASLMQRHAVVLHAAKQMYWSLSSDMTGILDLQACNQHKCKGSMIPTMECMP